MRPSYAMLRRFAPAGVQLTRDAHWFRSHGEPEVLLVPKLVPRGGVAVDVGAHDGMWSYWMARAAGHGGHVLAIEPLVEHAVKLRRACTQLRLHVEVHEVAVGDAPGEATLTTPVAAWGEVESWSTLSPHFPTDHPVRERRVAVKTLDELLAACPRVDLIKIDVEGHERAVLLGARATVCRHRPVLVVEVEARHSPTPVGETYDLLADMGYVLSFLDGEGFKRPIAELDPMQHLDAAGGRYVNNILARPS